MSSAINPTAKILALPEAVKWREQLRKKGQKLVITNGCFDIMHRGHAEYLYESAMCGDALLILINSDRAVKMLKGDLRPIVDEFNRAYMLSALSFVDAVVIFDAKRCDRELAALQPDFYVKGGDYTLDKLDKEERSALLAGGSEIIFKPFIPGFSTTTLIEKIMQTEK
ncbi:MAG: adenylyltransferase/cytidyltransferase family protein [Victivallaceae bacterium]